MTYKERYRRDHAKELRRAKIIEIILNIIVLIIAVISLFGATFFAACWDAESYVPLALAIIFFAIFFLCTVIIERAGWVDIDSGKYYDDEEEDEEYYL